MSYPILDLSQLPPGAMTFPYIVGGGVEGGRTISGLVNAIDMTGGGLVKVKYSAIGVQGGLPSKLRYWSYLAGVLNGGIRSIIVPIITDTIVPAENQGATITVADTVNSGAISIVVPNILKVDPYLSGGEWLGLVHPNKLNRAYQVTDVEVVIQNPDTVNYRVAIRPPLREAVTVGQAVNFSRPTCLMRLNPGSTMTLDLDAMYNATGEIDFIESLGGST